MAEPHIDRSFRPSWRAVLVLLLSLAVFAGAYGFLLADLYTRPPGIEQVFEEKRAEGPPPLDMYLEALEVDPIRQAINVRIDFAAKPEGSGLHFPIAPDRDLIVEVSDGNDVQDVNLHANQPTASKSLQLGLTGGVADYPLDRYEASLTIAALDGSRGTVPVRLTTWQEIPGWIINISKAETAGGRQGLALYVKAGRPHAHVFFAFVIYGAMILIAACGLTIGGLVFLGMRKIEAALTGALGAMVFAVPALRNVLPGAPPLGVKADAFVFLWVEAAVALGLTLFVARWARRGPPP